MSKIPSPYIAKRNEKIREDFVETLKQNPKWTVWDICHHLHDTKWPYLAAASLKFICYPDKRKGSGPI